MLRRRALHRVGTGDGRHADEGLRLARASGSMSLRSVRRDDAEASGRPSLPFGGGKAVLAVPSVPPGSEARPPLLERYAGPGRVARRHVRHGGDMNTSQSDMDVVGERTAHRLGRSRAHGGSGEPAPAPRSASSTGSAASVDMPSVRRTLVGPLACSCRGSARWGRASPSCWPDAGVELLVVPMCDPIARAWSPMRPAARSCRRRSAVDAVRRASHPARQGRSSTPRRSTRCGAPCRRVPRTTSSPIRSEPRRCARAGSSMPPTS